jgi:predicted RNase H-like HicB family nuclease
MTALSLYAVIRKEGNVWVALCPELDVASQGETIPQARANLQEAVELYLMTADDEEIPFLSNSETYISSFGVKIPSRFRH